MGGSAVQATGRLSSPGSCFLSWPAVGDLVGRGLGARLQGQVPAVCHYHLGRGIPCVARHRGEDPVPPGPLLPSASISGDIMLTSRWAVRRASLTWALRPFPGSVHSRTRDVEGERPPGVAVALLCPAASPVSHRDLNIGSFLGLSDPESCHQVESAGQYLHTCNVSQTLGPETPVVALFMDSCCSKMG